MAENQVATTQNQLPQKPATLQGLLSNDNVKKRFEEMLGKKAAGFISSIISATKANAELSQCEPNSIISSAVIAATLDLPIQSNLGFAAIIPYNQKQKDGTWLKVAQFQVMAKGYTQLGIRSGQYKNINVSEIYEGELVEWNRITGEFKADTSKKSSDKIVGYVAYISLITGFEKYLYMTKAECEAHGLKYSQTFKKGFGKWKDDFDVMARKTVLKLLLSRFGILSIDIQNAINYDQSVVKNPDTMEVEYPDNTVDETHVDIDKEGERIEFLIADCESKNQLESLKKEVDPKYHDLFTAKETELKK